jgi:hypothetical protein
VDVRYDQGDHVIDQGVAHPIFLGSMAISELTKPVSIPWPGLNYHSAARKFGVGMRVMTRWVKAGWLVVSERERFNGLKGKPTPVVYTPTPIDPGMQAASQPDYRWGTLWQWMHENVPDEWDVRLWREPRRGPGGKLGGWDWICPGRLRGGKQLPGACGRRCRVLYAPMMAWTLLRRFDVRKIAGFPSDFGVLEWESCFACQSCWRPTYDDTKRPWKVWNRFVTHVSGGLLTGRDVKKPTGKGRWDEIVEPLKGHNEKWYSLPEVRELRRDNHETHRAFVARRPLLRKRFAERKRRKLEAAKVEAQHPFADVDSAVVTSEELKKRRAQ